MSRFQWYSRSDLRLLVGIPLYASAYYVSMTLMWDHHFLLGIAVLVLGFFAADGLGNRLMAWICPGTSVSNRSRSPDDDAV